MPMKGIVYDAYVNFSNFLSNDIFHMTGPYSNIESHRHWNYEISLGKYSKLSVTPTENVSNFYSSMS